MKKCLYCHKTLRKYPYGDGHGYDGDDLFCTLRCGYRYAVAAVRTGRIR